MSALEDWTGRRASFEESRKILFERLSDLFQSGPSGDSVLALEVGCGDGQFSSTTLWRIFSTHHPSPKSRLYSLDRDLAAAATAWRRFSKLQSGSVRILQGDLYNLPIAEKKFDYLLAFNVFYWADRGKLLQEARRVLKEDGRVFTYDLVPTPVDGRRPVFFFSIARHQITAPC